MKKIDIKRMIKEHLRTRFMFEKETPEDETPDDPTTPEHPPTPAPDSNSAHDEAMKLGLTDRKFGRYADATGHIVAKSIDGKLVKVTPELPDEDRDASEPPKSGYNYDDAYGNDYPKPQNQLGAVPPEFKPVAPMKSIDHDPYEDPKKLNTNTSGRTGRVSLGKITGNPEDAKNTVSPAATWNMPDKSAASAGGAGTYKNAGHQEPISRTNPDGSLSWSEDGAMQTNGEQKEEGKANAVSMEKKYGKSVAITKCKSALELMEKKFKMIATHNTNSTEDRIRKLKKMQRTIDTLRHSLEYLQGKSLTESKLTDAGQQAVQLGLKHVGWGRYADKTGRIVAKAVNGQLVKMRRGAEEGDDFSLDAPQEAPVPETPPEAAAPAQQKSEKEKPLVGRKLEKELLTFFKSVGIEYVGRKPHDTNSKVKKPGWNKLRLHAEVEFDANAEETVQKLLEMIGDPVRTMRWLIKKFKNATPSGKKRIGMYILILKKLMGDEGTAELGEPVPNVPQM